MVKNLSDKVKYIGVDDLDLDLFESQYIVPEGMAYNSYVILDDKVAVLDTADARKADEWKANLKEALYGRQPDYLVVHHMEPDHSALIAWALEEFPARAHGPLARGNVQLRHDIRHTVLCRCFR